MKELNVDSVEVFGWGSCQYQEAAAQYRQWMAFGLEEVCSELAKIGKSLPAPLVILDAQAFIKAALTEELTQMFITERPELGKQLDAVTNVTTLLDFRRSSSWDLWSAISEVVAYIFPDWLFDLDEETGMACAMLQRLDYVKDSEPFQGFDT